MSLGFKRLNSVAGWLRASFEERNFALILSSFVSSVLQGAYSLAFPLNVSVCVFPSHIISLSVVDFLILLFGLSFRGTEL